MEGPPNFYTGSLNPRPLRPSIFQHSDPQNIATSSNHKKSHRHRHRHRDHHHEHSSSHSHSHRHSSRQHAKEVVQSTLQLQPPTSFGDLLKQAKGSKDTTPQHSRRQSIAKVDDETTAVGLEIPPPKPIRPDDVAREQRRVKLREEELRASLQSLSDQSLKTSRRLDDSHYTILEKVYQLQRTIDSLQELSDMTEELYENFKTDTKEMGEDVKSQVEGFNNFDVQQEQVTGLEERIKLGKEKADALTARLGEAKERVEARAKVEAEWEARTSRRLRVFWGILASIVGVVVISILVQQFRPIHVAKDHKANLDFAHRDKILDAPIPDEAKEAIIGPTLSSTMQSTKEESPSVHSAVELADDERLRIFDEL